MENKYYSPGKEEFYVGFEYEREDINEGGSTLSWFKQTVPANDLESIDDIFSWDDLGVRVKYLDREDIESLGYNYSFRFNEGYLQDNYKHKSNYSLLTYSPNSNFLSITNCESGEFLGVVKNKSELKKLLQQLNIKQVWRF
jgi:hypothetical protein